MNEPTNQPTNKQTRVNTLPSGGGNNKQNVFDNRPHAVLIVPVYK